MVTETAAAPADDPDIAAGNHHVAAAPRVSSYIAKLGETTPEELQAQYPGCAKLSGTPHALMDPKKSSGLSASGAPRSTRQPVEEKPVVRDEAQGPVPEGTRPRRRRGAPRERNADLLERDVLAGRPRELPLPGRIERVLSSEGECGRLCCCPNRQSQGDLHPLHEILVPQQGQAAHPAGTKLSDEQKEDGKEEDEGVEDEGKEEDEGVVNKGKEDEKGGDKAVKKKGKKTVPVQAEEEDGGTVRRETRLQKQQKQGGRGSKGGRGAVGKKKGTTETAKKTNERPKRKCKKT
eukprot:scaffold11966_cov51-Cyclotella_meneghiniana.AAC.1